jgi:hypothetical protein
VPDVRRFPNEHPDSLGPLFQALLTSFAGYDWRDGIAGLALPRLVIHGAADAFRSKAAASGCRPDPMPGSS